MKATRSRVIDHSQHTQHSKSSVATMSATFLTNCSLLPDRGTRLSRRKALSWSTVHERYSSTLSAIDTIHHQYVLLRYRSHARIRKLTVRISSIFSHNTEYRLANTDLLFRLRFIHCALVSPFILPCLPFSLTGERKSEKSL